MKKVLLSLLVIMTSLTVSAKDDKAAKDGKADDKAKLIEFVEFDPTESFTLVSRTPNEVLMRPDLAGGLVKGLIPKVGVATGQGDEYSYNCRELLKTGKDGKKYLVFVEFLETPLVTKVAVAYQIQNDLKNDTYKAFTLSFADLYKACKRRSSTFLEGQIMGMKVAIFQRPPTFSDIIIIDGYQIPSPIKIATYKADGFDIKEGTATEVIPGAYLPPVTAK